MFLGLDIGSSTWYDAVGLFILLAGFIIGLGAVTVIDIHGFLGRTSTYWTEATTRTHKVTKPLIWIGFALAFIGGAMLYRDQSFAGIPYLHFWLGVLLVANGCFLSFDVSPYLLKREKEGLGKTILPSRYQWAIALSMLVSFFGWWTSLVLLVAYLLVRY